MNSKSTKVLIVIPGLIPSITVGILRPLIRLEELGHINIRIRYSRLRFFLKSDMEWCDVAVFCRSCESYELELLYKLKRMGKKIIYELDDNFFSIEMNTPVGIYHRHFSRLFVLKQFLKFSNITRLYSNVISERAINYGANVQKINGYFDDRIISGLKIHDKTSKVKIVYPTGRLDDPELERLLYGSVKVILEKYPSLVEFHLWRLEAPEILSKVRNVVLHKPEVSYEKFIKKFFAEGFLVGLAPGIDSTFFRSKTNNKYREFAGCRIAGIYSNISPYDECVIDGFNGLLVENDVNSWAKAMERLITDSILAKEIIKNGHEDVLKNYSFSSSLNSWLQAFNSIGLKSDSPINRSVYYFANVIYLFENKDFDSKNYLNLLSKCSIIFKNIRFKMGRYESIFYELTNKNSNIYWFRLQSEDQLNILITMQNLDLNIIIDLTECNIRESLLEDFFLQYTHNILILNKNNNSLIELLKLNNVKYFEISKKSSFEDFDVDGRPCVFLEALDCMVNDRSHSIKTSSSSALSKFITSRFLRLHYIVTVYPKNILNFIKWRFGGRVL